MEDEKKKKRNKKKKNKQNKTTEGDAAVYVDHNHVSNGQNDLDRVCVAEAAEGSDITGQNDIVDLDRQWPNGVERFIIADAEKQQWQQREAALEETIKQSQKEIEAHTHREATLEETIKQLQTEIASHAHKEAALEGAIQQLRNTNDLWMLKEATFEEAIKQLKNENDLLMQKQADLEMKIEQLLSEKDDWLKKEASLGEKVKHLECEKDSWILTESTNKETIAKMNVDITRLRMQVVELEESRNSVLKENERLTENIAALRVQLQNFETSNSSVNLSDELRKASEHEDLNFQIEAAHQLVGKLITENAELVEKVNELHIKLDQQSAAPGLSSAIGSDPMVGNVEIAIADPMSQSRKNISLGHNLESLEAEPTAEVRYSAVTDSGEIVQIPLYDTEVQDLEQQAVESDDKDAVPLSDAPLIGAPFRLISFVAKYVSGADLVSNNT